MEEEKENNNNSLTQASALSSLIFHDVDILSIQKIFAGYDNGALELYTSEMIDPENLEFIPRNTWTSKLTSLESLQDCYFGRKNNVNRRFEHKLWNALQISQHFPNIARFVGVAWASHRVIKVYKYPFAKLLNIKVVDGGLFHKQGNFTRHGFIMLAESTARTEVSDEMLSDVDFHDVVLIFHKDNIFNQSSTEETISNCRWDDPSPKTRVASIKMEVMQNIE